jgi:hypothetical protein
VRSPRVLTEGYLPDADAVHVAQSQHVARYLRALGMEIVEHTTFTHRAEPGGLRGLYRKLLRRVPLWRNAWGNNLLVARRGRRSRHADLPPPSAVSRPLDLVFLTQTFPRSEEDTAGPFIRDLARGLVRGGDRVRVLAPHTAGVGDRWSEQGVEIETFRYAPRASRCWATAAASKPTKQ